MKTLTMLMAALLVTGVAQAQTPAPDAAQMKARLDARFVKADVDKDGKLSREEAKAGMPRVFEHFDEIDTAKSGYITEQQIGAYLAAHARQAKRAPAPAS